MPIQQRSPKACWNLMIHLCILHWHTFNMSLLRIHISILVPFLLPSLSLSLFFPPRMFVFFSFSLNSNRYIGLAKMFVWVFYNILWKNQNKLFGQPNTKSLKLFLNFQELDQKAGKLFLVFQVSNHPICSLAGHLTMWQGCPVDQNPQHSLGQWPRPVLPARSKDYLRPGNNLVPEIRSIVFKVD